jgi:ParB-like chromosome segregation protein Spo0J|tara:strand:+ start:81 stop:512 length:432 start_codon:yes stop_codon:yes gene_type:complete
MKKFRTYIAELRVERPNAKDTLGIKRDKMPQVRSKDYDELIAHLKKNGVSVQKKSVKATKLKATQSDFNVDKIVDKISSIKTLGKAKPLIVSSDSYIIDGHHRWLAAKNVGGSIDVMQSNVKVKELLKHVYSFPKTFTKGINE